MVAATLHHEEMKFPLGGRLREIFEPGMVLEDRLYSGTMRRVSRVAGTLRVVAATGVAVLLFSVGIYWEVSVHSARAIGITGLCLVFSFIGLPLVLLGNTTVESRNRAVEEVLEWSDKLGKFQKERGTLTGQERVEVVRFCRRYLANSLGSHVAAWLLQPWINRMLPEMPLPSASRSVLALALKGSKSWPEWGSVAAAPWIALAYLSTWTSAFLLAWSASPQPCEVGSSTCPGALQGFGDSPSFGDFVFLVMNASAANMPPDLAPRSRLAHFIFACAFVSALGILAVTATSLWRRVSSRSTDSPAG